MSRKTIQLTDDLHDYVLAHALREPEILRRLREETAEHPEAHMQIAPEQGQFMGLLVKLSGARKAIEIGVFTGYSSLAVALALPEDGHITACDVSEEYTATARRYWREAGVEDKIDLRIAPAEETLQRLLDEGLQATYDFAFVDADKGSYDTYYELTMKLLRPGGLIIFDNMFRGGRVADDSVQDPATVAIRTLNDKLHQDGRVDLSLVPVADGLSLVRKRG